MMRPTAPLVALAICVGLCACGSTSSASPDQLAAITADVAAAAANPVAVSPQPGTPDASSSTQISFLGSAATSVSNVRVVGSHSGVHTGVLRAYSTGTGESFIASRRFSPGERVTVTASVTTGGATGTRAARASRSPIRRRSARSSFRSTPAIRTRCSTTARRRR